MAVLISLSIFAVPEDLARTRRPVRACLEQSEGPKDDRGDLGSHSAATWSPAKVVVNGVGWLYYVRQSTNVEEEKD